MKRSLSGTVCLSCYKTNFKLSRACVREAKNKKIRHTVFANSENGSRFFVQNCKKRKIFCNFSEKIAKRRVKGLIFISIYIKMKYAKNVNNSRSRKNRQGRERFCG